MADSRILQLPAITPVLGTDVVPLVRGSGAGANKRATLDDLVALTIRRNALINGGFDVSQRGIAFALTTGFAYTIDRWFARQLTTAQSTVNQGALYPFAIAANRGMQIVLTGTSANAIQVCQVLETADSAYYQGKTVTFRFTCAKGSTWNPPNLGVILYWGTNVDGASGGLGGAGWTAGASPTFAPAAAFQTFSASMAVPTNATQLGVLFQATPTGAAVDANSYLWITDVSLTEGPVAPAGPLRNHFADELAICQRYYNKTFPYATAPAQNAGTAGSIWRPQLLGASVAQQLGEHRFPVRMRAVPGALTFYNPSAANAQMRNHTTGTDCSAFTAQNGTDTGFSFFTTSPAGSAAGNLLSIHCAADAEL